MDVSRIIKQRLLELGLDQRDLAAAIQVTESYVSQLLTRKKAPPAPTRTDLYDKISEFLKLPPGQLTELAAVQRREELKKRVATPPSPLFPQCRELILRKCASKRRQEIQRIFEKEPFGELERLVTQTILAAAQGVAKEELRDTDVFHSPVESYVGFLDPAIDAWDIDLKTFAMDVVLNRRLKPESIKRFEYTEREPNMSRTVEPGLEQFSKNASLSGDATEEEMAFLRSLKFKGKRPTAIYYYRELQNLRDPLHFPPA